MIKGISHITFIVKNMEQATNFPNKYLTQLKFIPAAITHVPLPEKSFLSSADNRLPSFPSLLIFKNILEFYCNSLHICNKFLTILVQMKGGFTMKILIVGYFTESSKTKIIDQFPTDWEIIITPPGEDILQHMEDCHVLIPEHIKVDNKLLSIAKNLKLVQTGAGFDNIDINACTKSGIWAANAAGVNAQAVAEHVMALILAYYKNIPFLDSFMKNKSDQNQLNYTGSEIADKTIGIIGLGAVGKKVANFCRAFDMNVLAYTRNTVSAPATSIKMTTFDDLIQKADIVSVHTALNPQTKHLINDSVFKKMKNSALFINTARGGLVSEIDLIQALKNRDIAGACLDVFETEPLPINSELLNLSNVILTPHTAGMPDSLKFHKKRYAFFINNIKLVAAGKEPENSLNHLL